MAENEATILVVEDELAIRRILQVTLACHGFRVVEASSGKEGVMLAATCQPDLVILDLGLPDMDGLQVLQQIRQRLRMPIVILSARGQEQEKVKILDAGADDYVTKPFSSGELLARLRVALRHKDLAGSDDASAVFEFGGLRVDLVRRQVSVDNVEVHLTSLEFRLLAALTRHAGRVVTHRQLLQEVWGPECVCETQYLRVYMTQLRRKLEADPIRPRFLITEPAVGYRLAGEHAIVAG